MDGALGLSRRILNLLRDPLTVPLLFYLMGTYIEYCRRPNPILSHFRSCSYSIMSDFDPQILIKLPAINKIRQNQIKIRHKSDIIYVRSLLLGAKYTSILVYLAPKKHEERNRHKERQEYLIKIHPTRLFGPTRLIGT